MMMKPVFWWRKPEYPEETTDLRQVTDETFHTYGLCLLSLLSRELHRSRSRTMGSIALSVRTFHVVTRRHAGDYENSFPPLTRP